MLGIKTLLVLALASLTVALELQKVSLVQSEYDLEDAEILFEEFIKVYERNYAGENEKQARLEFFKDNLKKYNEFNKRSRSPTFGINKFADHSPREKRMSFGLNPQSTVTNDCMVGSARDFNMTKKAPDAFDWREKNGVTSVKDQGLCGSCWAFSVIGLIESQYAIKTGNTSIDLSEQQLIDCDGNDGGCCGGYMSSALTYFIENGGAVSESEYPYNQCNNQCHHYGNNDKHSVIACNVFEYLPEDLIKEIVYSYGPVSVAIAAEGLSYYTGGIVKYCPGDINHAVLLVGYGSENGTDFWIVKNSWGLDFGESGFFRMERGVNMCRILNKQMTIVEI